MFSLWLRQQFGINSRLQLNLWNYFSTIIFQQFPASMTTFTCRVYDYTKWFCMSCLWAFLYYQQLRIWKTTDTNHWGWSWTRAGFVHHQWWVAAGGCHYPRAGEVSGSMNLGAQSSGSPWQRGQCMGLSPLPSVGLPGATRPHIDIIVSSQGPRWLTVWILPLLRLSANTSTTT